MGTYSKQGKINFLDNEVFIFGCILLLAGLIRWIFSPGIGRYDEILYANSAQALTQGTLTLTPIEGAGRIGVYAPLAILYYFWGPSITTTMLSPFLCSLITIFLLYKVVKLLGSSTSALLATLFWALHPLSIAIATSNYPDTPMAMVNIAAVYTWLLAEQSSKAKKILCYTACTFFLVWGMVTKQQIAITAGFLVLSTLVRNIPYKYKELVKQLFLKPLTWLGILLVLTIFLFWYGNFQAVSFPDALAITAQDVFGQLSTKAFFYITFPFLIIVLVHSLRSKSASHKFVGIWFVFTFVFLEWAPLSLNPTIYIPGAIRPLTDRTLLFLMFPVAIMAGLYLEKATNNLQPKVLFPLCLLIGTLAILSRADAIDKGWFLNFSTIAIFLFIMLSMLLPFLGQHTAIRKIYLFLFFLTLGISILNPLLKHIEFTYWDRAYYQNLHLAADIVMDQPAQLIYFHKDEDRRTLEHLNLVSGFQLAPDPFNDLSGRMQVFSHVAEVDKDSYIVILSPELLELIPPTWHLQAHFSQPPSFYYANPPELWLFQSAN